MRMAMRGPRMAMRGFDPRSPSLTGLRGLGAFDPRTRSLNGLGCDCQQPQNLSRLGFLARGQSNPLFRGVGRLGRLGRMGDDFTDAENLFLDTGVDVTPGAVPTSSTYDDYSNTLTAPTLNLGPLTTPQQIAAQQIWGTTNITAAQNQALIAAQTAGYNLTNLTAQQMATTKALASATGTMNTTAKLAPIVIYGAIGFGIFLLLTKK